MASTGAPASAPRWLFLRACKTPHDTRCRSWSTSEVYSYRTADVKQHLGCQSQDARAVEALPSSWHLCQRRFGLRQPEGHVHSAVQLDGSRQGGAGRLTTASL